MDPNYNEPFNGFCQDISSNLTTPNSVGKKRQPPPGAVEFAAVALVEATNQAVCDAMVYTHAKCNGPGQCAVCDNYAWKALLKLKREWGLS